MKSGSPLACLIRSIPGFSLEPDETNSVHTLLTLGLRFVLLSFHLIQDLSRIPFPKIILCVCARARVRENWSLTFREERKLKMLENTVLRKIFGPKRDEVTGEWRKLHNEELNDLYC